MHTVPPTPDKIPHRPPRRTRLAEWADELAYWSALRGLPPDPWPLP